MHPRMLGWGLIIAALTACSSSSPAPEGRVTVQFCQGNNCSVAGISNDGSTITVSVVATDATGAPATGAVHVSALVGTLDGKPAEDLTLDATGAATALYACDSTTDSACITSATLITATWNGITGSGRLVLSSQVATMDSGTTDAGMDAGTVDMPDAGGGTAHTNTLITLLSVYPVSIATQGAVGTELSNTATITFFVESDGIAAVGTEITFTTAIGEDLVTLSSTTADVDANGVVAVNVTSKTTIGVAHITATTAFGVNGATAAVGIFGPPASVIETASAPDVLGIHGSGIQEHGLMTFLVTDAYGTPVPDALVDFTQAQPTLVTLNASSGTTDQMGLVSVAYTSGNEVGVTSLTATVDGTSVEGLHPIAVRGARPSASGFYFRCDDGELQVFGTITGYQTMTCHVRLSDRFGNRVGIPTPVNFATEAGSITASAITAPFDPMNPSVEGTADVTFSTDIGNGFGPADVIPLLADTNPDQFPQQRMQAEPQSTDGAHTYNPRDNLVTIIAWTQGEEGFVDANHNGQYDMGELFVDQGDPFLDENDDNVYDQIVPGGQFEPRFCGSTTTGTCPAYQPPNGKWDAEATIWAPTWVVFTGPTHITDVPAGSTVASVFTPSSCADYADAPDKDGKHGADIRLPIYEYDQWFNTLPPAVGGTYTYTTIIGSIITNLENDLDFVTAVQQYGAFGQLGLDFTYGPVSAAAGGGACTTANGTQCVLALHFNNFSTGRLGDLVIHNSSLGLGESSCPPTQAGVPVGPAPIIISVSIIRLLGGVVETSSNFSYSLAEE